MSFKHMPYKHKALAIFHPDRHGTTRHLLDTIQELSDIEVIYAHNKDQIVDKLAEKPDVICISDGQDGDHGRGPFYGDLVLQQLRNELNYKGPILLWTWPGRFMVGRRFGADHTIVGPNSAAALRLAILETIHMNTGARMSSLLDYLVPSRFFVSHSSEDHDFAAKLAQGLSTYGQDVWYDKWELKIGESLLGRIQDGLDSCDFLVVVLSPDSVASKWVREEINAKFMEQMSSTETVVLPCLYRDCELPPFLRDKFYADFRGDFQPALHSFFARIPTQVKGGTNDITNK